MKALILHCKISCLELSGELKILTKINIGIVAMGTWLNEYVHNFCVEYDPIDVSDISNIRKYLMKKHNVR